MSGTPPLTPVQVAQWQAGMAALRRGTRAAGVARVSGWTLAAFGVLTALGGLLNPLNLAIAGAMGVLAWSELRGARDVRALRPAGSVRLVWNQLWILGLIVGYAGVNIGRALLGGPEAGLEPTGEEQVDRILADVSEMTRAITVAIYAGLVVVGVPLQAVMAWYHARRGRQLREALARTEGWVVDLARAA